MRKLLCMLLSVSLLAVSAGCSAGVAMDRGNVALPGANGEIQKTSGQTVPEDPAGKPDDLRAANQQFAFDIFRQLSKEDKNRNIFISPLSISVALSMAYQGAGGPTKAAMAETLGYGNMSTDRLNGSYRQLLKHFDNVDEKVELSISNSIWIREGEPVNETFLETNRDVFGAKATVLDFSSNNAVDTINGWVSRATKGKIEKIVSPPINEGVVMYLISAIYFKGQWAWTFNKKNTFTAEFNNADGTKSNVMMMSRKGMEEYAEGDNYKAVRLPYGSGKIAMYMILPDEGTDIDGFIEDLQPEFWNTLKDSFVKTTGVTVQVPRFRIEYGVKELQESLSALGMAEVFSESADFSGIRERTRISSVLHKAVIEVNEEGSEAAAVTSVEEQCTSAGPQVSFIADRPFIFAIADEDTDTVLFLGKVVRL